MFPVFGVWCETPSSPSSGILITVVLGFPRHGLLTRRNSTRSLSPRPLMVIPARTHSSSVLNALLIGHYDVTLSRKFYRLPSWINIWQSVLGSRSWTNRFERLTQFGHVTLILKTLAKKRVYKIFDQVTFIYKLCQTCSNVHPHLNRWWRAFGACLCTCWCHWWWAWRRRSERSMHEEDHAFNWS